MTETAPEYNEPDGPDVVDAPSVDTEGETVTTEGTGSEQESGTDQ